MGNHGRTGFARAILGSQAYRVIKGAAGPVLAVPQPAHLYDAP
jgi:nucleotide-binding universal stress UspA family protein